MTRLYSIVKKKIYPIKQRDKHSNKNKKKAVWAYNVRLQSIYVKKT